MRVIKYNKLVRDKIPDIIHADNRVCSIQILDEKEYINHLLLKVVEEATELSNATQQQDIIEELADVYQVLEDLISSMNISNKDIENVKLLKEKKRGSFKKRIFLKSVTSYDE